MKINNLLRGALVALHLLGNLGGSAATLFGECIGSLEQQREELVAVLTH